MKTPDLVSIIIPCFNQAQYLEESVHSALEQTYPEVEIIIVDDGSLDDTQQIATRLKNEHPKKIQVVSQDNGGVCVARNNGISVSAGSYIVPLDADDKLHKEMLTKCLHAMKDTNVDIVYTGYQGFGASDRVNIWQPFDQTLPLYITPCSATALFKRHVWETVNGYKCNMPEGYEDWDFWVTAYRHDMKFSHIPQKLFFYRIKEESRSTVAIQEDAYLKAKITLNNAEVYTKHRVQQSILTVKETENLSDLYFNHSATTPPDEESIQSALNTHLANNPVATTQVIRAAEVELGLCSLDLFAEPNSLERLRTELDTELIVFFSPLRYQVPELLNSTFAWERNSGIVKAHGSLFPFVPKSITDDPEVQLKAHQRLEQYHEYIETKLSNLQHRYDVDMKISTHRLSSLQHKYNVDLNNAETKLASLEHKYNVDLNIAKAKLASLQHKYNVDLNIAQEKQANLGHKYTVDTRIAEMKLASLQHKYNKDLQTAENMHRQADALIAELCSKSLYTSPIGKILAYARLHSFYTSHQIKSALSEKFDGARGDHRDSSSS